MIFPWFRRIPALVLLIIVLVLTGPIPVLADPYPTNVKAEPVDATSVLITWGGNEWAKGYRVHRTNAGIIAEVPVDVTSYLDTGLTPGIPYVYMVASVVDGQDHWYTGATPIVMPLDAPAAITSLSWETVTDYNNQVHLGIQLAWTPVQGAIGYEIFAMIQGEGGYEQWTETVESDVLAGFFLPSVPTRYWFRVRACKENFIPESGEYMYFTGPFSPEAFIDVPAIQTQLQKKPVSLFPLDTFTRLRTKPTVPPLEAVNLLDPGLTLATPALNVRPLEPRLLAPVPIPVSTPEPTLAPTLQRIDPVIILPRP